MWPLSFDENLLCFLLPFLRPWLDASPPRRFLGSALLYLLIALVSYFIPTDWALAGLQCLIAITIVGLALTLKVSLKVKIASVVLVVLSLLMLHQLSTRRPAAKKTD